MYAWYARWRRWWWWWWFLNGFDRQSVSIESENTVVVLYYFYTSTICGVSGICLLCAEGVDAVSMCHQKYFPFLFIRCARVRPSISYISLDAFFCLYRLAFFFSCFFCLWCLVCIEILCRALHKWEKDREREQMNEVVEEEENKQTRDCAEM